MTSGFFQVGQGTPGKTSGLIVQHSSLDQLRQFAAGGWLYAILDATDCIAVPAKMLELGGERAASLFRGTAEDRYWEVAPYLAKVDLELLDWIVKERWQEPWGLFAISKASLDDMRRHFRRFLVVQLPDRKKWYFRYYDPRILKVFLGTSEEGELVRFLGPVRGIVLPWNGQLFMCQLQSTQTPSGTHPAIFQMGAGQLQHLDQAAENDFIERMMEHIYELFPDETKNIAREQARSAISTWTKEARHWELLDEPDVERWIELCICHSEIRHAAETPWVIEILAYPGRSAAHKLERLQQRLIFLEA